MKKFRLLLTVAVMAFIVLGMMSSASAIIIYTDTQAQWFGSIPNNPDAGDVASIVGSGLLEELYKQDVGGPESGVFASSYATSFASTPADPADADIIYGTGPSISGAPLYLLVKDGDHDPIWYIFDLLNLDIDRDVLGDLEYSWNGIDPIFLRGFWGGVGPEGAGAISHVSIYGGTPVPEPATMLLLGFGMLGLAGFGRKFKKR